MSKFQKRLKRFQVFKAAQSKNKTQLIKQKNLEFKYNLMAQWMEVYGTHMKISMYFLHFKLLHMRLLS